MVEGLTKKQQKAAAFKNKQKSKRRGDGEVEQPDVPEQDLLDDDGEEVEKVVVKKEKAKKEVVKDVEEGGAEESEKKKGKRKKTAWDDDEEEEEGEKVAKKSKKDIKQRFILFVGKSSSARSLRRAYIRQSRVQDYQRSSRGCIQISSRYVTHRRTKLMFRRNPFSSTTYQQTQTWLYHASDISRYRFRRIHQCQFASTSP